MAVATISKQRALSLIPVCVCSKFQFFSFKFMPKDPKHLPELQAKRKAKKQLAGNYPPGKIYLQVIGNGSRGAPKSLYLYTDHNKYLFNCGEGTQRLSYEHKMKLSTVDNIFLTHLHWGCVGGLPGTLLTAQETGNVGVNIHGPSGCEMMFQSAGPILSLNNMRVSHTDCHEVSKSGKEWHFEDNIMKMRYIPVKSRIYNTQQHRDPPVAENYKRFMRRKNGRESPTPSPPSPKRVRTTDEYVEEYLQLAMCYLCSIHPKPGALRSDLCVEFGVPTGPLFAQLKAGNDITLPDGRVVRAKDVCGPEERGALFLVADCPSEAFLDNFISAHDFKPYEESSESSHLDFIVHFTPEKVLKSEKYREWMSRFPPSTEHLVLDGSNESTGFLGVHRAQHLLNLIDPTVFPLLKDRGIRTLQCEDVRKLELYGVTGPVVAGESCLKYHLRPLTKCDWTGVPVLNIEEVHNEAFNVPGFKEELEELKVKIENVEKKTSGKKYPQVLFLGTGSCIPNKTRNVSCILLEVSPNSYFMMDCGEGSLGQLVRFFGPETSDQVLCNLKGIFLSHFHADHHLGLMGLLLDRREAFERLKKDFEPLVLIAPVNLERWFLQCNHKFHRLEDDYQLLWSDSIHVLNKDYDEKRSKAQPIYKKLKGSLGIDVMTSYVKHCFLAYGITIIHKDGWKLTYSGDTMPSDELIQIGKGSDILIHEATMEDDLEDEAIIKQHSTTSQAIAVSRSMEAKFTLLTHFSQRYAKLPIIPENWDDRVGIAFDNMVVRPRDLGKLHQYLPSLKLVYQEYYRNMEEKTAKKLKHKEIRETELQKLQEKMKRKFGHSESEDSSQGNSINDGDTARAQIR